MSEKRDRQVERWLRQTLFFDLPEDDEETRDEASARLILDEMYRRSEGRDTARTLCRRRRRWGALLIAGVVVSGGAVAAAIGVWGAGQPKHPESVVPCRASAALDADAIGVSPSDDPVASCRRLWAEGKLPGTGERFPIPNLVACVTTRGVIEVFPGELSVCSELGIERADAELSEENDAVVAFQDRLVEEINLAECRPVDEVAQLVAKALDESKLEGWTVVVSPGSEAGMCGKIAVDGANTTIVINDF